MNINKMTNKIETDIGELEQATIEHIICENTITIAKNNWGFYIGALYIVVDNELIKTIFDTLSGDHYYYDNAGNKLWVDVE